MCNKRIQNGEEKKVERPVIGSNPFEAGTCNFLVR